MDVLLLIASIVCSIISIWHNTETFKKAVKTLWAVTGFVFLFEFLFGFFFGLMMYA